jgi:hypothetical protein
VQLSLSAARCAWINVSLAKFDVCLLQKTRLSGSSIGGNCRNHYQQGCVKCEMSLGGCHEVPIRFPYRCSTIARDYFRNVDQHVDDGAGNFTA